MNPTSDPVLAAYQQLETDYTAAEQAAAADAAAATALAAATNNKATTAAAVISTNNAIVADKAAIDAALAANYPVPAPLPPAANPAA